MRRVAAFAIRRRLLVIVGWVLALFLVTGALGAVGPSFRDAFSLPGTDSQAATDLLKREFSTAAADGDSIVWRVSSGSVRDAAVRARIEPMLKTVAAVQDVGSVTSPYSSTGAALISADGRTAYAPVRYSVESLKVPTTSLNAIVDAVQAAHTSTLKTAIGGSVVANLEIPTVGPRELIGVVFAAIVLFVAFGSVWAALVPILVAFVSLAIGSSALGLMSKVIEIGTTAPTIAALIGIGVGIDYALFIVARHRAALLQGAPVQEAIVRAVDTSGRAVLFAGITVCISLLGMLTLGISVLTGVAVGATVAVAITVIAALTLVPALLSFLGLRVLNRKRRAEAAAAAERRAAGQEVAPATVGTATRVPRLVASRPGLAALSATVLLLVLAGPLTSIRLGSADQGSNVASSTTRQAYDMLTEGFGAGFNGPLTVVAEVGSAADAQQLATSLGDVKGVDSVTPPVLSSNGKAAVIQVVPTTSPQDQRTSALITTIRGKTIPDSGVTAHIGGSTATFDDFAAAIAGKFWLFLLFVIGLSFLLLVVVFRSLAIPLVGAAMNLLSASAAFGIVVAVFQWGWGMQLLGVTRAGPTEPTLPVLAFAILFGLSMDYQVFLVTRIHEEWVRTGRAREAVLAGQTGTARVIASAALIMVFVFGSFVLGDSRTVKLIGTAMAVAVLLDAFVVRQFVVPGLLHLLRDRAWWLPRGLARRLPRIRLEEDTEPTASGPTSTRRGEALLN